MQSLWNCCVITGMKHVRLTVDSFPITSQPCRVLFLVYNIFIHLLLPPYTIWNRWHAIKMTSFTFTCTSSQNVQRVSVSYMQIHLHKIFQKFIHTNTNHTDTQHWLDMELLFCCLSLLLPLGAYPSYMEEDAYFDCFSQGFLRKYFPCLYAGSKAAQVAIVKGL